MKKTLKLIILMLLVTFNCSGCLINDIKELPNNLNMDASKFNAGKQESALSDMAKYDMSDESREKLVDTMESVADMKNLHDGGFFESAAKGDTYFNWNGVPIIGGALSLIGIDASEMARSRQKAQADAAISETKQTLAGDAKFQQSKRQQDAKDSQQKLIIFIVLAILAAIIIILFILKRRPEAGAIAAVGGRSKSTDLNVDYSDSALNYQASQLKTLCDSKGIDYDSVVYQYGNTAEGLSRAYVELSSS